MVTVDASVTYQGSSALNVTPPSAPNLCVIYGTVRDAAGVSIAGACVQAYAEVPQVVASTQKGERIASTHTDANGYFEIELVRTAIVNFTIEGTDLDVTRTVPDAANQDVTTWT